MIIPLQAVKDDQIENARQIPASSSRQLRVANPTKRYRYLAGVQGNVPSLGIQNETVLISLKTNASRRGT